VVVTALLSSQWKNSALANLTKENKNWKGKEKVRYLHSGDTYISDPAPASGAKLSGFNSEMFVSECLFHPAGRCLTDTGIGA
jgi:hypothetical protein